MLSLTSLSEIVDVIFVINGSVGRQGWIPYMSPNALNVLLRVNSQL